MLPEVKKHNMHAAHREYVADEVWYLLSSQADWLLEAIENIAEAFVYWGPDDRLMLCNSKYPLQFIEPEKVRPGVTFSELVEQNIRTGRVISFSGIEDVSAAPEAYRQKRMTMHSEGEGTFEVKNYTGKWLQARERRTRDGGTVGIYTDITNLKLAEQREHEAAQLAEDANKAKSRFLAAASHDLRQPLHAMGILISALSGRLRDPDERELLSGIESCLSTMQSLFDSLLDISRLDAGVIEPRHQVISLNDMLQEVEKEFAPQAARRGLEFRVRSTSYYSYSDRSMLGRIIRNLISNAIKYTDRGGVLVAVRKHRDDLHIDVWDTGIGFPPDQVAAMFEEFRQLEVGQVRRQGLGLGLSIANRLCDMLDHRIEVVSTEGKGSLFRVILPLIESECKATTESVETQESTHHDWIKKTCIAVLDDDLDNLQATALLLRDWGCEVVVADTLAEISRVEKCPDILLVDHHLKGTEKGTEAVELLQQKFDRHIPSIVITGDTEPEQLREIENLGFQVVHKPLKPIKLRAIIQQYI